MFADGDVGIFAGESFTIFQDNLSNAGERLQLLPCWCV